MSDEIYKWHDGGIPERYWATLRELGDNLSLEELHQANEAARAAQGVRA